jgi:hypothetical protein
MHKKMQNVLMKHYKALKKKNEFTEKQREI